MDVVQIHSVSIQLDTADTVLTTLQGSNVSHWGKENDLQNDFWWDMLVPKRVPLPPRIMEVKKGVSPIVVTFQIQPFYTSMIMGENVLTTVTSHIWGAQNDPLIFRRNPWFWFQLKLEKFFCCCWIALPFLEAVNSAQLMSQEGTVGSSQKKKSKWRNELGMCEHVSC